MKKEKFSFAKWLTTRDIEKIVTLLGLEIMTQKENPNKKRILRDKDEDGYHIMVFCQDLDKKKANAEIQKMLMQNPEFRKLTNSILSLTSVFALAAPDTFSSYFQANNLVVLNFGDFFVEEKLSLKCEDELIESCRTMSKIYQKYMSQKFGRHYNDMKRAYYKKLYQKVRNEEKNQENDEKL